MTVGLYDWERMKRWTWRLLKGKGYAYACIGNTVLAHRFVLNAKKGQQVDHINGNGLDNRRCNLRFATQSQNLANRKPKSRHGFKGIYFCQGRWVAMVCFERKRYYLGRYVSPERAAMAYDRAALAVAGAYAALNFPDRRYRKKAPAPLPTLH